MQDNVHIYLFVFGFGKDREIGFVGKGEVGNEKGEDDGKGDDEALSERENGAGVVSFVIKKRKIT